MKKLSYTSLSAALVLQACLPNGAALPKLPALGGSGSAQERTTAGSCVQVIPYAHEHDEEPILHRLRGGMQSGDGGDVKLRAQQASVASSPVDIQRRMPQQLAAAEGRDTSSPQAVLPSFQNEVDSIEELLDAVRHDGDDNAQEISSRIKRLGKRIELSDQDHKAAFEALRSRWASLQQDLKKIQQALAQAVTPEDLKQQLSLIRRLHEENQESRHDDHQGTRTYLEKMMAEARRVFAESRQVLLEKLLPLQHAGARGLQATQALEVAFDDTKKDLATRLTAQGRHYDQSLKASLGKLQQAMLTRLQASDGITVTSLRQVFAEYGIAGKLDNIQAEVSRSDKKLEELLAHQRREVKRRQQEELRSTQAQEDARQQAQKAQAQFARKSQEQLKKYYQTHYDTIKSFRGKEWPIKDAYVQLAIIENLQEHEEEAKYGDAADQLLDSYQSAYAAKKYIGLDNIFSKTTLKDSQVGVPKRVLLIGRAGIGKTTLCQKIAHQWANGTWAVEFEAVYLLPIRALNNYEGTLDLEHAIAKECFADGHTLDEQGTKARIAYIKGQLDAKGDKVLLILDGLDESNENATALLRQVQGARYQTTRQLWVSRPYNIDVERAKADLEIENIGFNDHQIAEYAKVCFEQEGQGGSTKVEPFLKYLHSYASLYATAHVPINLQILCDLWEQKGAMMLRAGKSSLTFLYRAM